MTHTSTEQTEALRLASALRGYKSMFIESVAADFEAAAKLLEASQAQRVPHDETHVYEEHQKYPGACRHCGYAEHEPLKHGITQEKQG